MAEQTLLVTGGSGHLGRRVLELLLEANAGKLVTTTRTPAKLADLAARGVEVRQADFDDTAALASAFRGVDRLLLISTDSAAYPSQRIAQHKAAVEAAASAGVQHILYTSFVRTEPGNPAAVAEDHYATEQAIIASRLDYTILRNNLYANNLLMSLPAAIAMGQLFSASNGGKTAYVTREDCARAAAAALAANTSGRQILDITGPHAVSDAEIAEIASQISGKPVQLVALSVADKQAGMVSAGLPAGVAALLLSFETASAQGYLDAVSNAVTELTGRAPQSVRDLLIAHKAALVGA